MRFLKSILYYIIVVSLIFVAIIYFIINGKSENDYSSNQINNISHASGLDNRKPDFLKDLIWAVSPEELADPGSIYLFEDKLIIQDYQSARPLPVLKADGSFSHYIGNWGRGPGEFSSAGHTVLGSRKGNILIYDRETSKLLAFEIETGNFLAEKTTEPKTFPYLQGNRLISRAAVPYENFAYGITLSDDLTLMTDTVIFGNYSRLKNLTHARKNHLLKQGAVVIDNKQNAYIALNNSSLILGFDLNGEIIFENDTPINMGSLPDLQNIKLPASHRGALISPPLNMFPKHYVDVSVNDKYLAGLYSGFQIKNRQDFLDSHKANEGKTLHIFDKKDSKFLYKVNLDHPWISFALKDESVFAVSLIPEPEITKYKVLF